MITTLYLLKAHLYVYLTTLLFFLTSYLTTLLVLVYSIVVPMKMIGVLQEHACSYGSARQLFLMYCIYKVWLNCECVCKYLLNMYG